MPEVLYGCVAETGVANLHKSFKSALLGWFHYMSTETSIQNILLLSKDHVHFKLVDYPWILLLLIFVNSLT